MKCLQKAFVTLWIAYSFNIVSLQAQDITVLWASTVPASSGVNSVGNALGRPNAIRNAFNDFASATFGGFGVGDNVSYNASALASLLGISTGLLQQGDFLALEWNATNETFETSTWVFSDGISSLTVPWIANGVAAPPIIAEDLISATSYNSFFGISGGATGHYTYLLFDIDGTLNVPSPNFTVSITSGAGNPHTPDIDALGVLVPEPGTCSLWIVALVSLIAQMRKRRR